MSIDPFASWAFVRAALKARDFSQPLLLTQHVCCVVYYLISLVGPNVVGALPPAGAPDDESIISAVDQVMDAANPDGGGIVGAVPPWVLPIAIDLLFKLLAKLRSK